MRVREFSLGIAASAIFLGVWIAAARAQTPVVKLNGGLQAQIAPPGRHKDGQYVTVSMILVNKGTNTVYLALVGAPPAAVDNGGIHYAYESTSGISKCVVWNSIDQCIGVPKTNGATLPLQTYTAMDPGTQLTAVFNLFSVSEGNGPLISFAANLAYRAVSDPLGDERLSEAQKRQQIRVMNVSFPPTRVVEDSK